MAAGTCKRLRLADGTAAVPMTSPPVQADIGVNADYIRTVLGLGTREEVDAIVTEDVLGPGCACLPQNARPAGASRRDRTSRFHHRV